MGVGESGGGRFELAPDAVASQLGKWSKLREDLLADQGHGMRLSRASSAGDEPASKTMANFVSMSGKEFLRHNIALVEYVDGYVAALTAALKTYVNGEDAAVHALREQD